MALDFIGSLGIVAATFLVLWPTVFVFLASALKKRAAALRQVWQARGWSDLDEFSFFLVHGGSVAQDSALRVNHPDATPSAIAETLVGLPGAWVTRWRIPLAWFAALHAMLIVLSVSVFRFVDEPTGWILLIVAAGLMLPLLFLVLGLLLPRGP